MQTAQLGRFQNKFYLWDLGAGSCRFIPERRVLCLIVSDFDVILRCVRPSVYALIVFEQNLLIL